MIGAWSPVAKAAAKGRKGSRGSKATSSEVTSGRLSEALGLCLIGVAALAALALATYSDQDSPLFLSGEQDVLNRAGSLGASLAYGLIWLMGMGSVVFVAAMAFLGGNLVLGQGLPPISSRFWIGSSLVIVSVACRHIFC